MGFRRSDLQPAFSVPGTYHFTVWGYGTTDTLDEVLRPGYVQAGRSALSLGDLVYVRTLPRRDRPDGPERGETRVALVMVAAWNLTGGATLRLVHDFGRPDDAGAQLRAAPTAPAAQAPAPTPSANDDPPKPAKKKPRVVAKKAAAASAKSVPPVSAQPESVRSRRSSPAPAPTPEPPRRSASRSPDPTPEPPRRKRGRPPKNRARLGG